MVSATQKTFLEQVREGVARRRVVPVVGAGVSMSAAGLPSWSGALRLAIDHLAATRAVDESALRGLEGDLAAGELIRAFNTVVGLLSGVNELAAWLRDTFRRETDEITDWSLLVLLQQLACPIVATTNFDRLLSDFDVVQQRTAASWDEPATMQQILKEGAGVLHLHGRFDRPRSVVLGSQDYDELVSSEAYAAVLRSLWLEHTLLFVGCSFDGLQDPDFSGLLDWAMRAFPDTPVRHFALLRSPDVSTERAARLLQRRVQIIDYGPSYDGLAARLREINPFREEVVAGVANRIREIVDRHDPSDAATLSQHLLHVLRSDTSGADATHAAEALLVRRSREADELREELMGLQQIARQLATPQQLADARAVLQSLPDEATLRASWPVVTAATRAIELFPLRLLVALRQRGVRLDHIISGHALMWTAELGLDLDKGRYDRDDSASRRWGVSSYRPAYKLENAARVLTCLENILDADAIKLFPPLTKGVGARPDGPCIVVTRRERIELRPLDDPSRRIAVLSSTGAAPQAHVVPGPGGPMVVSHSAGAVTWWRPYESLDPVAVFTVGDSVGIDSVCHSMTADGLVTFVAAERSIRRLVDFEQESAIPLPAYHNLHRYAVLPDETLIACDAGSEALVLVGRDGAAEDLVVPEELRSELVRAGALPADARQVHVWRPTVASVGERTVAVVELGVDRWTDQGWAYEAAAVVYDIADFTTPTAVFRTPRQAQLISTRVVTTGSDTCRIVAGSLPDPVSEGEPLIVRSPPFQPFERSALLPDAELLREDGVLAAVAMLDERRGWAGVGGSLYELDFDAKTSKLLAEDAATSIRAIDLLVPDRPAGDGAGGTRTT